jgi:hypothetical protein
MSSLERRGCWGEGWWGGSHKYGDIDMRGGSVGVEPWSDGEFDVQLEDFLKIEVKMRIKKCGNSICIVVYRSLISGRSSGRRSQTHALTHTRVALERPAALQPPVIKLKHQTSKLPQDSETPRDGTERYPEARGTPFRDADNSASPVPFCIAWSPR